MKTQVWVYVMVAVLSLGAGVAIAGVPNSVDRDPTIEPPPDTGDTDARSTVSSPPETGSATDPTSGGVPAPTPETSASTDSTPDSTLGTTPSPGSTTSTTIAAETTPPPPPRAELDIAVANGAEVGGSASEVSDALEARGYVDVGSFDGSQVVDITTVYYTIGFEAAAEAMALDMGMDPSRIRPIAEVPGIGGLGTQPLVVYLGRDVVNLSIFL